MAADCLASRHDADELVALEHEQPELARRRDRTVTRRIVEERHLPK